MMKTLYRALFAQLLLIAFAVGTQQATAQVTHNCCTFRIIVPFSIPDSCMPVSVTTKWGTAIPQTDVVTTKGPGNPSLTIAAVPCPPIAPIAPLQWVSLDGGVTQIPFSEPGKVNTTLPCGICVQLNVLRELNGCLTIIVAPCDP
jgi:hypothetical protein